MKQQCRRNELVCTVEMHRFIEHSEQQDGQRKHELTRGKPSNCNPNCMTGATKEAGEW